MSQEDVTNENVVDTNVEGNGADFVYTEEGEVYGATPEEMGAQDFENMPREQWSIQQIWNDIVNIERRAPKERDYISFSDIGKKDFWSRYMKMKGVPESNKFEPRVLRIFQAGDEFHDLVKTIFKKAGLFINSQDDLDANGNLQYTDIPATKTTLRQYGMYDILVGGKPDLDAALKWIEESDLSQFGKAKAEKIARHFAENYAGGLRPILYDVKSINSQAFWAKKAYLNEAYPHHRHQLYGYLKGNHKDPKALEMIRARGVNYDSIDEARVLYVSKDDLTVAEFPININDSELAESYNRDVETISGFILSNTEPPKPPYIVFNKRKTHSFQHLKKKYKVKGCWEANWEVTRSPYFTLMTGLKTSDEFEELVKEDIKEKNKVIKDIVLKKVGLSDSKKK